MYLSFSSSVAALTDCMRNKTLAKFFRDRQAGLKRSLPLGSYLLKPVQRILKYHLLLQVLKVQKRQLFLPSQNVTRHYSEALTVFVFCV